MRGETTSVLFVRKYLHIQPSREQKGLVKIRLEGDGKGGNNICAFCGKVFAYKRAYERVRDVGRVFKDDVSRLIGMSGALCVCVCVCVCERERESLCGTFH